MEELLEILSDCLNVAQDIDGKLDEINGGASHA